MLDHVSVAVRDLRASADAYGRVLGALGYQRLVERPATVGFGKKYPEFWLNARPGLTPLPAETGIHICLRAAGEDAGARIPRPGDRGRLGGRRCAWAAAGRDDAPITAAFVQDPDGNKLEAATFPRKA